MPLRVQRIRIRNVLGIDELELEPGKLTVVEGRNGAGKTSILNAVRHAIEGGKDATLIRNGETFGQTVIEFDDETVLRRRYYADGTDSLDVNHPILGKTTGAKTWAKKLVHALSLNPVDFITQPSKRIAWMLEANPVPVPVDAIAEALAALQEDDGPPELAEGEAESHALPVLNRLEKKLFDDRGDLNKAVKEKEGTAKQMADVMPPAPEAGDWSAEATAIETARETMRAEKAEKLRAVEGEYAAAEARYQKRHSDLELDAEKRKAAEIETLRKAAQAKIDEINAQLARDTARVQAACAGAIAGSEETRDQDVSAAALVRDMARDEIASEYSRREEETASNLAVARERAGAADRHRSAQGMLDFINETIGEMKERSERFTLALEAIRNLKRQVCETLPIPDTEVVDGEIVVGGVPYDRLPQSRQIRIAVDIAALSAGELGLICVDGLEHLDSTSWPEFVAAAEEKGLQMIVARVADSELSITVDSNRAKSSSFIVSADEPPSF